MKTKPNPNLAGGCSHSHAPAGSPSPGFEFFEGGLKKTVTSVWLSRFDSWKVSWKDNKGGGGITNLEYFMENTEDVDASRKENNVGMFNSKHPCKEDVRVIYSYTGNAGWFYLQAPGYPAKLVEGRLVDPLQSAKQRYIREVVSPNDEHTDARKD